MDPNYVFYCFTYRLPRILNGTGLIYIFSTKINIKSSLRVLESSMSQAEKHIFAVALFMNYAEEILSFLVLQWSSSRAV